MKWKIEADICPEIIIINFRVKQISLLEGKSYTIPHWRSVDSHSRYNLTIKLGLSNYGVEGLGLEWNAKEKLIYALKTS